MSKSVSNNVRKIGLDHSPYITEEMYANHNGDVNNVYKIIYMVKSSGADADINNW